MLRDAADEGPISYEQALALTLGAVEPLPSEPVPLAELGGRVAAADVPARVDVPPADVSLKDGYAVQSADVRAATGACPVRLRLLGAAAAGRPFAGELPPGSAIRVLSGACIPPGADAVLAEEFARVDGDALLAVADAAAGRNVLARGTDVALSSVVIAKGTLLGPAQIGLVAAAGFTRLDVVRRPRVGLIAIGDEVVAPGGELREGQVYASNLVTLAAWCAHFGLQACMAVVGDESAAIERQLLEDWPSCDVILTCGGAWRGERDLIAGALARLGWRKLYHHVRLGPGKAAGFGLWREVPVFCLPGGPPSSQAAFLQLALPALLRLAGYRRPGLPTLVAELAEDLSGEAGWTQVVEGLLAPTATGVSFQPRKARSRLQSMAGAQALAMIPEGTARIPRGAFLPVQLLPAALAGDPSGMAAGGPARGRVRRPIRGRQDHLSRAPDPRAGGSRPARGSPEAPRAHQPIRRAGQRHVPPLPGWRAGGRRGLQRAGGHLPPGRRLSGVGVRDRAATGWAGPGAGRGLQAGRIPEDRDPPARAPSRAALRAARAAGARDRRTV